MEFIGGFHGGSWLGFAYPATAQVQAWFEASMEIAHESALPDLHRHFVEFAHHLHLPCLSGHKHGSDPTRGLVHTSDSFQFDRDSTLVVHVLTHGWLGDSQ
jgi:hypothetical protein